MCANRTGSRLRRVGKAALFLSVSVIAGVFVKRKITVPQHHICFGVSLRSLTCHRPAYVQ
jgi:hypothetical protein